MRLSSLRSWVLLTASFLLLAGTQRPSSKYRLLIDCKGEGVNNTGSNDQLNVQFLDADRQVLPGVGRKPQARRWIGIISDAACGEAAEFAKDIEFTNETEVKFVQLSTTGDDAFWVDRVELQRVGKRELWRTDVRWGQDGGNGYCLSTNRRDYEGSWEAFVGSGRECRECFEFQVDRERVSNNCD